MMRIAFLIALTAALLFPAVAVAQVPDPWHDDLVDHLAGTWKMEGNVMGRAAHHDVRAEWVLNHQFLRIEEKTSSGAARRARSGLTMRFGFWATIRSANGMCCT